MEIDVTFLVQEGNFERYSASQAEAGPFAGELTWKAAVARAHLTPRPLNSVLQLNAAHAYFVDDTLSSAETLVVDPLGADPAVTLRAMFIQWVAMNCREADISWPMSPEDWARVEREAQEGNIAGDLWPGKDGRIYASLSR